MRLRRIQDLELEGKSVLLRLDLNVPIKNGVIQDKTRILKALPTIKYIREKGGKVAIISHLGRPRGQPQSQYSLEPVGAVLAEELQIEVVFIEDFIGPGFEEVLSQLKQTQVALLENCRFHKQETENNAIFARRLMQPFDIYVNDAFGALHRAHASVVEAPKCIDPEKRAAGFLIQNECQQLSEVLDHAKHPFTVILGGSKVSDKLGVILSLIERCNHLLIGGAMAYTFLKYKGVKTGSSRTEDAKLDAVAKIYQMASNRRVTVELPIDHIVADKFAETALAKTTSSPHIDDGWMGLDIGPETIRRYTEVINDSKTVFWNGPMGVFEWEAFSQGTIKIAQAVAKLSGKTVVGGGDSISAIKKAGVAEAISHISTGGGASLEYLEGKVLPGIRVLLTNEQLRG